MLRAVRPANGLRFGLCTLAVIVALTAIGTDPADARAAAQAPQGRVPYSPPYAALVVDANSGDVLHAANPDALRHPASLTKIMTLYLLFEQIEAGKLRLDSRLEVSDHASQQAPSKLGLLPGQTISVEDAIRALVTKSANDAAVVVAEAIGGDEETFARMMTRKARALGMSRTVYTNASGLPDADQLTTARDQATLGRAIQDRFPRYYRYFATPSFTYRGHAMRNHNKLLGRVEGVDGIKTGYTRASGFNLVSSVRRGSRHVVAVVLGGASGAARDARMRALIEQHIASASTQPHRRQDRRETTDVAAAAPKISKPELVAKPEFRPIRDDAMAPVAVANAAAVETSEPARRRNRSAPATSRARAEARLGRADQSRQGEDHHGEGRQRADRRAGPARRPGPAGRPGAPRISRRRAPAVAPLRARGILGMLPAEPAQPATVYQTAAATSAPGHDRVRRSASTASARALDHPGRRVSQGDGSEGPPACSAVARQEHARQGRSVHRAVREGQSGILPRALCRLRPAGAEAACKYFKRNDIACMAIRN